MNYIHIIIDCAIKNGINIHVVSNTATVSLSLSMSIIIISLSITLMIFSLIFGNYQTVLLIICM